MKKVKRVWQENKVLLVLGIILMVCLAVVVIVSLTYFYGSSDSVYGKRLESIKNVPLNDKLFKDIENELKTNEAVKEVTTKLKGKIVYINIEFIEATKMEDAKNVATSTLELFNDDELEVYDIEFTISSLSTTDFVGYTLMGARNANGSGVVVWNNYNVVNEEVEE